MQPNRKNKMRLNPKQAGKRLSRFEQLMTEQVVGQAEAITAITSSYRTALAGLNCKNRPQGVLLFLGPTGTGKTKAVEATAKAIFGNPSAMLKVDCAEFQHSHEIAKLLGSPPGYLGHRETHPYFTQDRLNMHMTEEEPFAVVLFDEIEKANDALWNLLLGILDKGTCTLGDNRLSDFHHAFIFLTSNLGAREITELTDSHRGFSPVQKDAAHKQITETAIAAARRKFSPEFMNRIDKTVVFRHLSPEDLRLVLDLELRDLQDRIIESKGKPFFFECSEPVKAALMREGFDHRSGARNLRRVIERKLVQAFSNLLITEQVRGGDLVLVDLEEGEFRFTCTQSLLPMPPKTNSAQMEDF
jgi:ATP-dependent Clp protease ATP-binding subunit ClpB